MGLVSDNFTSPDVMQRLKGDCAIGHNRYSTTGEPALHNVQPLFAETAVGGFAVAHNGNITNARKLKASLRETGSIFQSTSDTEVHPPPPRHVDQVLDDRAVRGCGAAAGRRVCAGRAHQVHADRLPRCARHPPARHRRLRGLVHPHVRDLRARHHRRPLRARRRARRDGHHHRERHRIAAPVPGHGVPLLPVRVRLLRPPRQRRRRPRSLRRAGSASARSWRARPLPRRTW